MPTSSPVVSPKETRDFITETPEFILLSLDCSQVFMSVFSDTQNVKSLMNSPQIRYICCLYPGVKVVWHIVRESELADALATVVPRRIPTVRDLKVAFTKDWTTDSPLNLMEYSSGLVCAYDAFLNGLRSNEDVDRLKKSRDHTSDWANGWQCTSFAGGRAKLCGAKKGSRAWGLWTVCFCKGPKHFSPPAVVIIGKDGNPPDPSVVNWTTSCPLSALELLWQLQDQPRRYAKWLGSGRFGKMNIGDPVQTAIAWFKSQGVSGPFDRNSGRKCLARWARHLQLEYPHIFQIMGDLEVGIFFEQLSSLKKTTY